MRHLFKIFLTLNSLLLSLMIFFIKKSVIITSLHSTFTDLPNIVSYIIYLEIIIALTWLSLKLIRFFDSDSIESGSIISVEPVNDAFLPSYLGYFFIALSGKIRVETI